MPRPMSPIDTIPIVEGSHYEESAGYCRCFEKESTIDCNPRVNQYIVQLNTQYLYIQKKKPRYTRVQPWDCLSKSQLQMYNLHRYNVLGRFRDFC
jgi:hypothetical protein